MYPSRYIERGGPVFLKNENATFEGWGARHGDFWDAVFGGFWGAQNEFDGF